MQYEYSTIGKCHEIVLSKGFYIFEVWGAQGGNCDFEESGRGGYSKASIKFESSQKLFVCVGGMGESSSTEVKEGGFNGGGKSKPAPNSKYKSCGGSGGGATDIRTSDLPSSRIIVAGGGGGYASYHNNDLKIHVTSYGGFGGGFEGGTNGTTPNYGGGASITSPGKGGVFSSSSKCNADSGNEDGIGGNACSTSSATAGGGGGGYYGGGGGADTGSGGGGSGFISQMMRKIQLLGGNETFLSPSDLIEIGHGGNGYARITLIVMKSCSNLNLRHILAPLIFTCIIYK